MVDVQSMPMLTAIGRNMAAMAAPMSHLVELFIHALIFVDDAWAPRLSVELVVLIYQLLVAFADIVCSSEA